MNDHAGMIFLGVRVVVEHTINEKWKFLCFRLIPKPKLIGHYSEFL